MFYDDDMTTDGVAADAGTQEEVATDMPAEGTEEAAPEASEETAA